MNCERRVSSGSGAHLVRHRRFDRAVSPDDWTAVPDRLTLVCYGAVLKHTPPEALLLSLLPRFPPPSHYFTLMRTSSDQSSPTLSTTLIQRSR